MANVIRAPGVLGSHLDSKFRQLAAKRVSAARYNLFQQEGGASSGAIANEDLVVANFASSIFNIEGDTLITTCIGGMTPNANNKQVHFSVEDESGTGYAGYNSPVYTVAAGTIRFHFIIHTRFTSGKTLASEIVFMSNVAGAPFVGIEHSAFLPPYDAKKTTVKIESTGGAANDVFLYYTWMEFLPGFLG